MSVPTLQQVVEEHNTRHSVATVIIGGTELPKWTSINYNFAVGQTPTATIIVPGLAHLPSAVKEEAAVQIWFGYRVGVSVLQKLVFGGAIVDSIGNNGSEIAIDCVMNGARKLQYSYNRRISYNFASVQATVAVTALLTLAGVANYAVNLPPWPIGTFVPQTIQFSTYGEAINKVAEVDGSPWYCLPTGQVRVEDRYPIPSISARRTYFTGVLTGPVETQPVGIENPDAKPRVEDIQRRTFRDQVANFIEVDGAVVTTIGPNGEQNSEQITETVDGLSGQFPNGAYWIPTPPLFQDFTFSNELIDYNAKAFEVAERYFDLKNRLFEDLTISVPGDPDVFLCETVRVKDPSYSGVNSLYFVKSYSTSITENSCTTDLQLTGGPESGTIGFASPFAEFTWTYDFNVTRVGPPGGSGNEIELPPNTDVGAKLCEDFPEQEDEPDAEDEDGDNTLDVADNHASDIGDSAVVYIGLNGTHSQDFDGYIVSWVWTWTDHLDVEHTVNGPRWTLIVNPESQSSVEVTLTVTDNSGRTDSITKTVRTSVNYEPNPSNPNQPYDPTDGEEDTEEGGGTTIGPCSIPEFPDPYCDDGISPPCPVRCEGMERAFFVAAKSVAMASLDNRTWNDLTKAAADVAGDFISVDAGINNANQVGIGIFGTSQGEIVRTIDNCETGTLVFTVPGNPRIECIHFDSEDMGESGGDIPEPSETPTSGEVPIYTQANPGTLTITQAYQQARLVGFSHDTAIIAVAIMKAESGLYSKAVNTAGNTPPSTDRGIAQINDYYHPSVTDACAYNTQCAIEYMYKLSKGGSDFSAWAVYTVSRYKDHLSEVQAEVGNLSGDAISPQAPSSDVAPSSLRIWAGTSDGRIYVSDDSGRNWSLHVDFGDGYPILQLGTPPRYGAQTSSLWAFGGDTDNIESLVRIDPAKIGQFVSLDIQGDLRAEIIAAGAGAAVRSSMNDTASILVFTDTIMSPSVRVWTSLDPLGDSSSWIPCPVGTGTYNTVAPGFDGDFVVAGSTVMLTRDNENFVGLGSGPDTIRHMVWRGLPGMYTVAMDDGLYQTIDFGDMFGALRPNATFATTWPAGAEALQVAVSIGARECEEPTPGVCDNAPRYEAAAGMEIVPEYFTNDQLLSASILGASVDVPDTSLVTSYYEGDAGFNHLGKESGVGSSLVISVEPTIKDSFLFLAIVSREGDTPDSVTDNQSLTWALIDSDLHSDSVGDKRLSVYRANANADSILGLDITIAFPAAQTIILAIVDEWIGLTTVPGDDPVISSDTAINAGTTPTDHPDDYLLEYDFTNNDANFEHANVTPPSFGIALVLEECGPLLGNEIISFIGLFSGWNGSFDVYDSGLESEVQTGDLLVALAVGGSTGANLTVGLSGGAYTWVLQGSAVGGRYTGFQVFTADITSTPDGTETVTMSGAPSPGNFGFVTIVRVRGVDLSGPVVQVVESSIPVPGVNSVTIPFASFASSENYGLVVSHINPSLWVSECDYVVSGYDSRFISGHMPGIPADFTVTTSGVGFGPASAFGLELKML